MPISLILAFLAITICSRRRVSPSKSLLLFTLLTAGIPTLAQHHEDVAGTELIAQGRWSAVRSDLKLEGKWRALFKIAEGYFDGDIELVGHPSLIRGKVDGSIRAKKIDFRLVYNGRDLADFSGAMEGAVVRGSFRTADGFEGVWDGWLELPRENTGQQWETPKPRLRSIPPNVSAALARAERTEALVLLDSIDVEQRTARRRAAARVRINTDEILEFRAREFAFVKEEVRVSVGEGLRVIQDYSQLPMMFIQIHDEAALNRLMQDPRVLALYENGTIEPQLAQSLPLVGQPQAHASGWGGMGQVIAVADSGVHYTFEEFGPCSAPGEPRDPGGVCRVSANIEIAKECVGTTEPCASDADCGPGGTCSGDGSDGGSDPAGHGTLVAAVAARVAPEARIVVLDVTRPSDNAYTDAAMMAAINWAVANRNSRPDGPIVALNMSIGRPKSAHCPESMYEISVSNAVHAGIVFVAASGNDGTISSIFEPACVPSATSVGAVYDGGPYPFGHGGCTDSSYVADRVACFSNASAYLSILAPGDTITLASGFGNFGTSFAAPFVAGAIAVVRERYPASTATEVTNLVLNTGSLVLDHRIPSYFPRLDLSKAIAVVPSCRGDCNADGQVAIDEIITGVRISHGLAPVTECTAMDYNADGAITIDEIQAAVMHALFGCS